MSIFKANDIRGVYGTELTDKDAYRLGKAFVAFTKEERIIIGRDNRLSSPSLHRALSKGILDAGADVLDIGLIDSPGFYFATSYLEYPGIMITASHNPARYNGFYVCQSHAVPINEQNGLKKIEKLCRTQIKNKQRGKQYPTPLMRAYTKHVLRFAHEKKHRPITVVIDAGNGMGAPIATRVFQAFRDITVIPLYFDSKGSFPHHGPDPSKIENLQDLGKKVLETEADFGIAFDGDADRAGFVDDKGEPIEGSLIGALLAQYLLQHHSKEKIVYSSTCSRILPETIVRSKGKPLRDKVGHTFIKLRMRKENALFGVENTGHYMYRENDYADSGIITAILMCEICAKYNRPLSNLMKPFRKYVSTHEINFATPHAMRFIPPLMQLVKKNKPHRIDISDGISADFGSYWISIRASHTEPLLRLIVEGKDRKKVEEIKKMMTGKITDMLERSQNRKGEKH